MFNDLIEVEKSIFLTKVWPAISHNVSVEQSNWNEPRDECFPLFMIIKWSINESQKKKVIAVSVSDEFCPDRYWVDKKYT